jgi:hypothetical protein
MHRIKSAAGLGAIALSLFALGCPQGADLDNPNFYCQPGGSIVDPNTKLVTGCMPVAAGGTSGTAGSGSGGMAMASCEDAMCLKAIINAPAGCKLCHPSNPAARQSGSLDFETPGFAARLKDQPAEHAGLPAGTDKATACPAGDKLVNSASVMDSWLLKKITGMQGSCGTVMPSTGALSATDQACFTTFINCVATSGAPAGGGGMPASTGGGGSGGAATGGGGSGGAATGGGGSGGSGGAKGGSGGTGGV